jgi:hypothetical protein
MTCPDEYRNLNTVGHDEWLIAFAAVGLFVVFLGVPLLSLILI